MAVTDRRLMNPRFSDALEKALQNGVRLIQLREKNLEKETLQGLATEAAQLCTLYGAQLQINGNTQLAEELSCGLHLPEAAIGELTTARPRLGAQALIGASCHTLENALRAQGNGVDYIVFGSIFPTASHTDTIPAGLEALKEVASRMTIPVYAIGGITAANCMSCLQAGAHGVAAISAVWDNVTIDDSYRDFLAQK